MGVIRVDAVSMADAVQKLKARINAYDYDMGEFDTQSVCIVECDDYSDCCEEN